MRFSAAIVTLLPAVTFAQEQKPLGVFGENLQAWYDTARSYFPTSLSNPIDAGASKIAAKNVVVLTKDNWQETLKPRPSATAAQGPENWMIFISGGNKTCLGRCVGVENRWNESAAVFAADPTAPNLGYINCENNAILCSIWAAAPPSVWYIQLPIPAADQSKPATTIHVVRLNTTTTTTQEIVQIHIKKTYEKLPAIQGIFHPFDGQLARFGLNMPVGYALFAFSLIPSWAFMIGVSFLSRTLM